MPFSHSFSFTPPKRFGSGIGAWEGVRIEESSADVSFAAVETLPLDGVQVAPSGFDTDPSAPQTRGITTDAATLETGYFRVVWIDGDGDESPASESVFSPGGSSADAFADTDCIANRLGRELTAAEELKAEEMLLAATAIVVAELGKDDAWAAALSPVPELLRSVVCSLATRAFANPEGAQAQSETLGAYSYNQRFGEYPGLVLTHVERLLIRQAVFGRTTLSVRLRSHVDDIYEALIGS